MAFWAALPAVLGGVAAVGSLISGNKARKDQKRAVNAQVDLANQQKGLYEQTQPNYMDVLMALRNNAGMAGMPAGTVGANFGPYSMLTSPAYLAALQQARQGIGQSTNKLMDQFSFGVGRRGLGGSNLDAAGRAAILAQAGQQEGIFRRNQIINAPIDFNSRIQALLGALNPGLGGAGVASNIFGQNAALAGQNLAGAGAGLNQAISDFMFLQQTGGNAPNIQTPPINGGTGNQQLLEALRRVIQPGQLQLGSNYR